MKINGYFILDGEVKSFHVTDPKRGLDYVLFERARPHGEWIYHKEWELDGECAYECSKCGMGADIDYNYCPRCGADMRKEGDSDA